MLGSRQELLQIIIQRQVLFIGNLARSAGRENLRGEFSGHRSRRKSRNNVANDLKRLVDILKRLFDAMNDRSKCRAIIAKHGCLSASISVCLSFYLSGCLSISICACLPACLSVCLPVCLSACVLAGLPLYLSNQLSKFSLFYLFH